MQLEQNFVFSFLLRPKAYECELVGIAEYLKPEASFPGVRQNLTHIPCQACAEWSGIRSDPLECQLVDVPWLAEIEEETWESDLYSCP